ncbi:group II intron maturase-specific domain-containing protein [Rhizobium sp. 268]|uniref:group II intron maturase-specific domain-containing protein n=1 Tax=Rhizobium sp. 268 TaxID=2996375 RepID=UPI003FA74E02
MAESAGADAGRRSRRQRTRNATGRGNQPLLANLFLHYAFDMWMCRNFPDIPFERYADDAICHCRTEDQAMALQGTLDARFTDCGLTLPPDKAKIVYCRNESRRGTHPVYKFDFLDYTFRPRLVSKKAGGMGILFGHAASPTSLKAIRGTIRSWSLHLRNDKALDDLAGMFNSYIRGWINYYGRFCPSALQSTLWSVEQYLARWASGKYKSLRRHKRRPRHWLLRIAQRQPRPFAHWPLLHGYGRTMGAG